MQYATRLLSTKPSLVKRAPQIASELVYEYKDHGFVIDVNEAEAHLGSEWVKTNTSKLAFSEDIYNLFDQVNLYLLIYKQKRLLVIGDINSFPLIFERPKA